MAQPEPVAALAERGGPAVARQEGRRPLPRPVELRPADRVDAQVNWVKPPDRQPMLDRVDGEP